MEVREAMKKAFKAAEENFKTTQTKIKNELIELKRLLKRERVIKRPACQYISSDHNPSHINHHKKVHDQNIPLAALATAIMFVPPAQKSQSQQYQY